MSSSNETGHARNVTNFESLLEHCIGYGATYAPSNPALTVTAMQTKLAEARASLDNVRPAYTAHENATGARKRAFVDLRKLTTRAFNALKASGASSETIADARTRINRFRGIRSTPVVNPPATETPAIHDADTPAAAENATLGHRTVSSAHLSFDQRAETFASLLEVLSAEPLYQPNESELAISNLQAIRANLTAVTTAVLQQEVVYENALTARDEVMYNEQTGLVANAKAIKLYVKSVYGPSSPQYKGISRLMFRIIKAR